MFRFPPSRPRQIVVSLDGNIGAGKSTLLEKLRSLPWLHVIDEPVGTWEKFQTADGKNLLQHFYSDTQRWAYTFQNAAILTRMCHIRKTLAENPNVEVFVTERSTITDKFVFAKMLHQDGLLNDMEMGLYNEWFDNFAKNIPVEYVLWLDTDVPTCLERIHKRGRAGEESIKVDYLEKLDRAHQNWLTSPEMANKCTAIHSDVTVDQVERILLTALYGDDPKSLNAASSGNNEDVECCIQ